MKKFQLLAALFLLMIIPLQAQAENDKNVMKMEELTIQVMPEFSYHPKDKKKSHPPLLVGYHGSFTNTDSKPQKGQIVIPLPMNEKDFKIGFVADYSSDLKEMNEIEYVVDREKGTISWETSYEIQPEERYKFVIEYYTNSIKETNGVKKLNYEFSSFTNIGLFNLIFIEPLKTDRFTLDPSPEQAQKNSYNMNMFLYQRQDMQTGEQKNISLEYKRSEAKTTSEIMDDMAGDAKKTGTVKKNEDKIPVWIVMIVIGGITLAVGSVLVFILKKRSVKQANEDKKPKDQIIETKKAKLRTMLMEKSITEEEYQILLKKITSNPHKES